MHRFACGNVLAAEREPWRVIDPKPYVGDPTYDALQHMLNCDGRLHADPHGLVRRMADLLGLKAERLTLWLFARCVQESAQWPQLAEVAPQGGTCIVGHLSASLLPPPIRDPSRKAAVDRLLVDRPGLLAFSLASQSRCSGSALAR